VRLVGLAMRVERGLVDPPPWVWAQNALVTDLSTATFADLAGVASHIEARTYERLADTLLRPRIPGEAKSAG
jgi:hypothetical protein